MLRHVLRMTPLVLCAILAVPQDRGPKEIPFENAKAYTDAEAYNVYAAVLPDEWAWSQAHAKTLVIRVETEPYAMCLVPDEEGKKVLDSAIADYKKLNAKRWSLQRQFDIEKPYELISQDEISTILEKGGGGWDGFNQRYADSGGFITLSAVGLNSSKTVAIVFAGHSCGPLCGGGAHHILQKTKGKWVPLRVPLISSCEWAS